MFDRMVRQLKGKTPASSSKSGRRQTGTLLELIKSKAIPKALGHGLVTSFTYAAVGREGILTGTIRPLNMARDAPVPQGRLVEFISRLPDCLRDNWEQAQKEGLVIMLRSFKTDLPSMQTLPYEAAGNNVPTCLIAVVEVQPQGR